MQATVKLNTEVNHKLIGSEIQLQQVSFYLIYLYQAIIFVNLNIKIIFTYFKTILQFASMENTNNI